MGDVGKIHHRVGECCFALAPGHLLVVVVVPAFGIHYHLLCGDAGKHKVLPAHIAEVAGVLTPVGCSLGHNAESVKQLMAEGVPPLESERSAVIISTFADGIVYLVQKPPGTRNSLQALPATGPPPRASVP